VQQNNEKSTFEKKVPLENEVTFKPLFTKDNLAFMVLGLGLIALGMILMAGGKSDTNKFEASKVYNSTRIIIAPILITLGLAVEIFAIMKRPKK
jgi:uncharacterized membrane protein